MSALGYFDSGGGLGCINAISYSVYQHLETGQRLRLPDPPRMMGEAAVKLGCKVGDSLLVDGRTYQIARDSVGAFAQDVTPPRIKSPGEIHQDELFAEHERRRYHKSGRRNLKYRKQAAAECDIVFELYHDGNWDELIKMLDGDLTPLARRLAIGNLSVPRSPYREQAESGRLR